MNILTLLKKDHSKVKELFNELFQAGDRAVKTRTALFNQINEELTLHTQIEEDLFYPAVKKYTETRGLILEAYEEHAVVKTLLHDINALSAEDERWIAKVTVLQENVRHHIQEEEESLFPQVEQLIEKEELTLMGKKMQVIKERVT